MVVIRYVLLREGPTDDGLVALLSNLIARCDGVDEVLGDSRPYTGTVAKKLRAVLNEGVYIDLIFVHRDSDSKLSEQRYLEINSAATDQGLPPPEVVGVVPVQETEAWLLTDPSAICSVVGGRLSGKLAIPKVAQIESKSSPKEILKAALIEASGTTGRRRKNVARLFSRHREVLLARLDIDGPLAELPSFRRLVSDVANAVEVIVEESV